MKVREASTENNATDRSPYEWLCQKSDESEMFFWKMVINLQINYLIFVRSEREGNFKLYVGAIRRLIKWYFIYDKYNYSRWLSVHLFDLMTLETMYPDVYENLRNGCFSFQKTNRKFSRMALDQVHEQNSRTIKSCSGATDLVNKVDESALIRWKTCGPDVARLLCEFEQSMKHNISPTGLGFERHHEDSPSFREILISDCESAIIIEMSPLIRAKCFASKDIACFSDFAVLIYYKVLKLGAAHQRIDLVFDRYFDNSLKEDTRKNRGSGSTFIFDNNTNLPNDMADNFMKNIKNKYALIEYLAEILIEMHQGSKLLITTLKNTVLCSSSTEPINLPETSISNCQSEEADNDLFVTFRIVLLTTVNLNK